MYWKANVDWTPATTNDLRSCCSRGDEWNCFFFIFLLVMLYYGCILTFSFLGCLNCNDIWGGAVVVLLPIIIPPYVELGLPRLGRDLHRH